MEKWLLVVAGEKTEFKDTQKAWLRTGMFLTIVPAMKDVTHRLLDKDYMAMAAFSDDPSSVSPFFAEIRRSKPNIPVIFMPPEQGTSPEEITRLLNAVVGAVELERSEQPAAQEDSRVWSEQQPLTCRDLSIYPQFHKTFFQGQEIPLSHYQF